MIIQDNRQNDNNKKPITSFSLYELFVQELQDFYKTNKMPTTISRDLKYILWLQKRKLDSRNITAEEKLNKLELSTSKYYKDSKYAITRNIDAYIREVKYIINNSKKVSFKNRIVLNGMLTKFRKEKVAENTTYNCPNCGAISTVLQLESGCPYCNTKFKITDLYPKVTNYYYYRSLGNIEVLISILIFLSLTVIGKPILGFLVSISVSIIISILKGDNLKMLLYSTKSSKMPMTNLLKNYDPHFSFEFFETRIIMLLKMILYSENNYNIPVYEGEEEIPEYNIIDTSYKGVMGVKKCEIDGNYCNVDLELYALNTYAKNKKIFRKHDVVELTVTKNITKPSDFGFSISKIECKSCGSSFDTIKEKVCPYCKSDYNLKDDDWVVTRIKIK